MRRAGSILLGISLSAGLLGTGCSSEPGKPGDEESVPVDGKSDGFSAAEHHGTIDFGRFSPAHLLETHPFHAWDFSLTDGASIAISTRAPAGSDAELDTVVYLYREGAAGWGRYLARNDDADGTTWSRLVQDLEAGSYRIVVKGYTRAEEGPFGVTVSCDGDGCLPACVLGDSLGDLTAGQSPYVVVTERRVIVPGQELATLEADQVRAAVVLTGVTGDTLDELIAATDDERVEVAELWDEAGQRAYTAFWAYAGDNAFGLIFAQGTLDEVAAIQDSDLEGCTDAPVPAR